MMLLHITSKKIKDSSHKSGDVNGTWKRVFKLYLDLLTNTCVGGRILRTFLSVNTLSCTCCCTCPRLTIICYTANIRGKITLCIGLTAHRYKRDYRMHSEIIYVRKHIVLLLYMLLVDNNLLHKKFRGIHHNLRCLHSAMLQNRLQNTF